MASTKEKKIDKKKRWVHDVVIEADCAMRSDVRWFSSRGR